METQTLADYLNEIGASRDTIQQGFRYYIGEVSDDLPPDEMEDEFMVATDNRQSVHAQLKELESSEQQLEEIALLYLTEAWQDPDQREAIKRSIAAANVKLPVIETAIISIAAMYAMYLLATRGKSSVTRRTKRNADGTFTQVEEIRYANPSTWIRGIIGTFGGNPPPNV